MTFRSSGSTALYCRLGGDPTEVNNQTVLLPSEDNREALAMWDGESEALAPTGANAPGCEIGQPIAPGS